MYIHTSIFVEITLYLKRIKISRGHMSISISFLFLDLIFMSFFDNIMTTNPTNFYYQQYHPSQPPPPTTTTTDNTDFTKLDKDLIYK